MSNGLIFGPNGLFLISRSSWSWTCYLWYQPLGLSWINPMTLELTDAIKTLNLRVTWFFVTKMPIKKLNLGVESSSSQVLGANAATPSPIWNTQILLPILFDFLQYRQSCRSMAQFQYSTSKANIIDLFHFKHSGSGKLQVLRSRLCVRSTVAC